MMTLALAALALQTRPVPGAGLPTEFESQRAPSFRTGGNLLVRNGRILTVTRGVIEGGDVLILKGKIAAVGKSLVAPGGTKTIDARGRFVTPGLVDAHSHRGADSINEGATSISAEVRMTDVLNPDDKGVYDALASGITTELLLHGSANPIGGQSVVTKNKYRHTPEETIFPGAPRFVKFALGENPKRPGGQQRDPRFPASRMGVEAVYRRAFADARDYAANLKAWGERPTATRGPRPRRDLRLEALADILSGAIRVQCHSYRQDEMLMMVRLSQEFGFNLTLQHALEAYKIAPELAKARVPVSIFGDGYAYKLEVVDSMPMAAAILDKAGVLVSINTDTSGGVAPLAQDAGKALRYGLSPERALRMITINPAIELGIDGKVGSIEVGKDGDLAIWDGHPLSAYSKCAETFIEGEPFFERRDAFGLDASSVAADSVATSPYDPDATIMPKLSDRYVIANATIHPVSAPPFVGSVVIANGVIASTVPNNGGSVGQVVNAVRIEGKGLDVYPGFVDAGSQLGLVEIGQVPSATDARENGTFNPDLRFTTAINPESVQWAKVRYNGVTSAMVFGTSGLVMGQSGVVSTLDSSVEGMRLSAMSGLDVSVPEGLSADARAGLTPEARRRRQAGTDARRKDLRNYFDRAVRYVAAKAAGEPEPTDVRLEAMRPYLAGQKPVILHAEGEDALRWSLGFARDLKLRGVLFGASESWRVLPAIKASGLPVIVSPPVGENPATDETRSPFDPYDTPMALGALLSRAGIPFAFASGDWDTAMNLPFRAGRACAFGLSKEAAMRAMTLDAAKILGVEDRIGSIERGKRADLVVVAGDPMELSSRLRYLFVGGRPVPLESKYTALYRKYAARAGLR